MKPETQAIHAGQPSDPVTGAVTIPIYQTSTYEQEAIGKPRAGYEYSRTGNPTRVALENALAALEGACHGLAFSSGVAASEAVIRLLKPGDEIIAGDDLYGGTYRLFEKVWRPWGLSIRYVDAADPAAFAAAISPRSRLLWVETPTNPLLKIVDLAALGRLARDKHLWLAVDNTFASPYLQRPLEFGAHLVIHSTTKYLGGHSDVIGGAVLTSDPALFEALRYLQNAAGAVPAPWDCWLVLRGLKTLPLRMRAHGENALALAQYLESHPAVARVYYSGLSSHPQHSLARRQMRNYGGMISAELKGGFPAVESFVGNLRLFKLAESLGGVESLVCYPPRMTHASLPAEERRHRGIGDGLVRLSVGIEHVDDLRLDLERALEAARRNSG